MDSFIDNLKFRKNLVIVINNKWSVDQLCSIYLAKIFLSLKLNVDVKIISNYFSGSEIFLLNDYICEKKDIIFEFEPTTKTINITEIGNTTFQKIVNINTNSFTDYFYDLIIKNDFVIDKEIIGFYTLLGYKFSTLYNEENEKNKRIFKLFKILTDEEFYTLEYNVDQVVERIDNYVL